MSEPNYVTCLCQHCNGHLKFDSNQLRKGEIRQIECPHCHLETRLYIPTNAGQTSNSKQEKDTPKKAPNGQHPHSSKSELALFGITRFLALLGAILVLCALLITIFLGVQTLLPEKPEPIHIVSYESVAPAPEIEIPTEKQLIPSGPRMASEGAFPQPVVDFLLKHQGFSLKEWLSQLSDSHRKPFLDNLATVITTAKSKSLSNEKTEKLVRDYSDLWILLNERVPDPNAALEKRIYRASCISVAFGLFIALTILCLILVLLAIERNTRALMQSSKN